MDTKKLENIQAKNESALMRKANVASVGYGYKVVDGKKTDEVCIVVGVTKKIKKEIIGKRDLVPSKVDGASTDVIEVGFIQAQPKRPKKPRKKAQAQATKVIDPTRKFRPAMPGISIGHKNITAGTFGCVVRKNGTRFILSNNHVLANCNDADIGDAIYQPGPIDGGSLLDKIGVLDDFVPIVYEGGGTPTPPTCPVARAAAGAANIFAKILGRKHRLVAVRIDGLNSALSGPNLVDAALAKPDSDADIIEDIVQIGKPIGVIEAALGMPIQKYGRTTHYTTGEVLQVNATVSVSYGDNRVARFEKQIITGDMSDGGDSGSAILDMNRCLTGLLFAGSDQVTIFSPIQKVFELLGVSL